MNSTSLLNIDEAMDEVNVTVDNTEVSNDTVADAGVANLVAEKAPKVKKEKVPVVYNKYNNATSIAQGINACMTLAGQLTFYRGEIRFKTDLTLINRESFELMGWTINDEKSFVSTKLA